MFLRYKIRKFKATGTNCNFNHFSFITKPIVIFVWNSSPKDYLFGPMSLRFEYQNHTLLLNFINNLWQFTTNKLIKHQYNFEKGLGNVKIITVPPPQDLQLWKPVLMSLKREPNYNISWWKLEANRKNPLSHHITIKHRFNPSEMTKFE